MVEGALFELVVPSHPAGRFAVVSFRGEEAVSKPFSFEIVTTASGVDAAALDADVVGQRGSLLLRGEGETGRAIHGVFRRVEAEGVSGGDEDRHHYRFWLVPRFARLSLNRNSRIFQDQTVRQIVEHVLGDSAVPCRFDLLRAHAPRGYTVQYQESDRRLVERLLAEEGIYYFFEHAGEEGGDDTVVFTDDASLARPVAGEPGMHFRDSGGMSEREDDIRRFRVSHRLRPRTALIRQFDWLRPSLALTASAEVRDEAASLIAGLASGISGLAPGLSGLASGVSGLASDVGGLASRASGLASDVSGLGSSVSGLGSGVSGLGSGVSGLGSSVSGLGSGVSGLASGAVDRVAALVGSSLLERGGPPTFRMYDHHLELEGATVDEPTARRHLEQHRRHAAVAEAESRCKRLAPGRWFELRGAAIPAHDGRYLVLAVEHEGHQPEATRGAGGSAPEVYRNRSWSVPGDVAYRPKRPRRALQQVVETATVVGPAAQEIHTDAHGRIRVQFHWDRDGQKNERSSCWIRVMQAWAGAGWGAQFIPRVGMEVIVSFVGGDVDRPMVMGCVYNAEHPVPFPLPREKTKSGIRSQTSKGGGGYNEMSFEDRAGFEVLHLRAERDMETLARRNHTARVGVHLTEQVGQNRFSLVGGNQVEAVSGNVTRAVGGDEELTTDGARVARVRGDERTEVGGGAEHRVARDVHTEIRGELLQEVRGAATVLVGRHDAKRSAALVVEGTAQLTGSGIVEVASDSEVVIRCGNSSIRIAPDEIEIASPKVTVRGDDARLLLEEGKAKLKAKSLWQVVSDDKVVIKSSGASLALGSDAKLAGSKVRLGAAASASDDIPDAPPRTKIELVDQDGNPIPRQRFRIVLDDGSQTTGVLDEEGKAEVDVPEGGHIVFPGLQDVEQG